MNRVLLLRIALVGLGGLLIARGAWVALTTIPSVDRIHVALWFALGVVAHDGLLAPLSVLLGHTVLPRLPAGARAPARALALWTGTALVVGVPLVVQARHRYNPTIEIGHPATGLAVAVLAGVAVAAVLRAVGRVRGRPGRRPATPR